MTKASVSQWDTTAANNTDIADIPLGENQMYPRDVNNAIRTVMAQVKATDWRRELLTANRTYYVRTDGSNSNDGLANTSGGAFLTIQKAWDTVCALDLNTFTATIQVADGTYTSGIVTSLSPFGGSVTVQGNSGTPANVVVSATSANAFAFNGPLSAVVTVKDMKIQTTTLGNALTLAASGKVLFGNINFGATASAYYHVFANGTGARIETSGNYAISGGAAVHIIAADGASINTDGRTVTLTGTPAFTTFAVGVRAGSVVARSVTYSGSATGTRYSATSAGGIDAGGGGASYFPGNAAGSATSPGWYV